MKSERATREMTLEQARTRLEGALERLEAIEPALEKAHAQLLSPRWRTELSTSPRCLEAVARLGATLDQDLASARRLLARATCPELLAVVDHVERLEGELISVARGHLGGHPDAALDALLHATVQRGRAELPRPMDSEEHVVLSSPFDGAWELLSLGMAAGIGAAAMATCAHLGVDVQNALSWVAGGAAVGTLASTALGTARSGGEAVLTTKRLLSKPRQADPVEVPLAEIPAGAVRTTLLRRTVELTHPRPLRMCGVAQRRKLAARIELERWLYTLGAAAPDEPARWNLLLLSHRMGSRTQEPPWCALLSATGYAVVPGFPTTDIHRKLGGVLGATPSVPITLGELCAALRRLAPGDAEPAFERLARELGTSVRRDLRMWRQHGHANLVGLERESRIFWFEPTAYPDALALGTLLAGWEPQEAEGTRWEFR